MVLLHLDIMAVVQEGGVVLHLPFPIVEDPMVLLLDLHIIILLQWDGAVDRDPVDHHLMVVVEDPVIVVDMADLLRDVIEIDLVVVQVWIGIVMDHQDLMVNENDMVEEEEVVVVLQEIGDIRIGILIEMDLLEMDRLEMMGIQVISDNVVVVIVLLDNDVSDQTNNYPSRKGGIYGNKRKEFTVDKNMFRYMYMYMIGNICNFMIFSLYTNTHTHTHTIFL